MPFDGNPVETDVRSYAGYDDMAKNLASHGYAVMSVETNTANFDNGWRDGGAEARSQIIQANLQLLYRWHKGAGPYVPGEPDHTVGTKLTGKLDFANPIGMMGHSRGGDAVTDFIGYTRNLTPPSGFPRMRLGAVLALAPVNYTATRCPTASTTACCCRPATATSRCSRARASSRTRSTRPPGPDGPPSTPPGPVLDPPRTAPTGVCADTRKPTAKLTQLAVKAKKVWIGGTAADHGCAGGRGAAAGGVARTLVELYKPAGSGKARFARANGSLSKPLPLSQGIAITAKGRARWQLGVAKAKLPRGTYRVRVSTFDRSGNLTRLKVRSLRIR